MNHRMQQAVDFLYDLPRFTTKNNLEHTRFFLRQLGEPGKNGKIIHVAGSNGKGSVCCAVYHMLLEAGKRTAMFTSPHLIDIRERFQINGSMVSEEEFLAAFETVRLKAEQMVKSGWKHPTFFEFVFAVGMVLFARAQVEYIVLETGLGGRLDATNSLDAPTLTVITSVSLEHMDVLGNTIEQIAKEKAGIIKRKIPVVFWDERQEAGRVIRDRAKELQSECIGVSPRSVKIWEIKRNAIDFSLLTDYDESKVWRIPGNADWQAKNAALALMAMRMLQKLRMLEAVPDDVLQRGLFRAVWPGRMQEIRPEIYLDGAHNTGGIEAFVSAVKSLTQGDAHMPMLLFSMVRDKDVSGAVKLLVKEPLWDKIAVVSLPGERGCDAEELQSLFLRQMARGANSETAETTVQAFADEKEAFFSLQVKKKDGQKLFCTGSLYFVGAILGLLQDKMTDKTESR